VADRSIEVTGIAETVRALEEFPKEVVVIGFVQALHAAADVVAAEVAHWTPLTKRYGGLLEYRGELRDNLQKKVMIFNDVSGGMAQVGFFRDPYARVAAWVEWGHVGVGHKPDKVVWGVVKPIPFMRTAADISAEPAVEAFAKSLENTVNAKYRAAKVA
jgi:hypothetical protein